jgi:hypothetical protein
LLASGGDCGCGCFELLLAGRRSRLHRFRPVMMLFDGVDGAAVPQGRGDDERLVQGERARFDKTLLTRDA